MGRYAQSRRRGSDHVTLALIAPVITEVDGELFWTAPGVSPARARIMRAPDDVAYAAVDEVDWAEGVWALPGVPDGQYYRIRGYDEAGRLVTAWSNTFVWV